MIMDLKLINIEYKIKNEYKMESSVVSVWDIVVDELTLDG